MTTLAIDSIEYLFADACPCGQPRADSVFCNACRSEHENLLSIARSSLPNKADPLPGVCKICFYPHPTYRCPQIWQALLSDNVCMSCGDPAVHDLCMACTEAGERVIGVAA